MACERGPKVQSRPTGRLYRSTLQLSGLVLAVATFVSPGACQTPNGPLARSPPPIPDFAVAPIAPRSLLPRLAIPDSAQRPSALAAPGRHLLVTNIQLAGNSSLDEAEIETLLQPYVGRYLNFGDLQELRDAIASAYVEKGFLATTVRIPDQDVADGTLTIEVLEGKLRGVKVHSAGRLKAGYVSRHIDPAGAVNVFDIEHQLQLLQKNPRIARLKAMLVPADVPGTATLDLVVREAPSLRLDVSLDNHTPPSIGEETARLQVSHNNLSGWGDELALGFVRSEGLQDFTASYRATFSRRNATLALAWRDSRSEVTEQPFRSLAIEGAAHTASIGLTMPVYATTYSQLDLFATGELRRSRSYLFGSPFSFSRGVENGVAKVAVLRLGVDWSSSGALQAVAARSTLSFGMDALDATRSYSTSPDSQFVTWLGQLQYSRRLSGRLGQIVARADLQLSSAPLLGLEQFAAGGHASVRGYRENTYLRDQGGVASIEWRVPFFVGTNSVPRLQIGPFLDAGYVRDRGEQRRSESLSSIGAGLQWAISRRSRLEFYWAHTLRTADSGGEHALQDDGLHFALMVAR